jgi:streptogramin lyase
VVTPLTQGVAGGRMMFMSLEDHEGGLWFASSERGLLRLPPDWRSFAVFRAGEGDAAAWRCASWQRAGARWPRVAGRLARVDRALDPATGRSRPSRHSRAS